ncbi:uncharacterized protein LOC116383800 [Anarrhichthys ocellatus]|uniref:uncharacterized protein LOC116383800 n=1 Tax=Anarrhichthys ocellatus TaxID=433405 RepID=UPI0012ECC8EE|nr:uncharacterized protein LOC116383800 [Anarrhichthys ocellatus]
MGNYLDDVSRRNESRAKMEKEKKLDDFRKKIPKGLDMTVDKSVVIFTSLSASDGLRQHYEKRKMEAGDCAPDWIKSLAEKMAGLSSAPVLAGLGAFAVAVYIDTVFFSPPEESTKNALRSVFADEKASEVWDQIDECLKRCVMHLCDNNKLTGDIERIEYLLSAALTKLKNSMVRDGHMSSSALKAWVNGAAFHIQMLIHLVRLGGIRTCKPVETLLSTYQSDLETLLTEHKKMVRAKCKFKDIQAYMEIRWRFLVDEDSVRHDLEDNIPVEKYFEVYYDQRYDRQKAEIQLYFRDVSQNLQKLVEQRGSFNV